MVTDWDSWREGEAGVEASQILAVIAANVALAHEETCAPLPPRYRKAGKRPMDRALDHAIITDRAKWPHQMVARLGAVAGRVLR